MLAPVGGAMIIYAWITSGRRSLLMLVLAIIAAEFVLGFVSDSKELSIRAMVLLILAKFLIEGRVPKQWIALAAVAIALTFSVFQAYRLEIFQVREQSRQEALQNLSANLGKALNSKMLREGQAVSGTEKFIERISFKSTIEVIVERTGRSAEFQDGYTLSLLLYAFIPRLILPNKPDSSVGQMFNREFHFSEDRDTYISVTHLGELFWNYGWPGLLIGMTVIGAVLGVASSSWSLRERANLTRFLLLMSTIYLVCFRFESGVALQYTLWLRTVFLILLLHLMFRGRPVAAST
jgi:hypothetical protein